MTITVTHAFVSTVPDDPSVPQEVRPSNWNANHTINGGAFGLLLWDSGGQIDEIPQTTFWDGTNFIIGGTNAAGTGGGNVALIAGNDSAAGAGGNVILTAGTSVSGVPGTIYAENIPTTDPGFPDALWNSNNQLVFSGFTGAVSLPLPFFGPSNPPWVRPSLNIGGSSSAFNTWLNQGGQVYSFGATAFSNNGSGPAVAPGTVYAPGDTITIAGGTGTAAVGTITDTQLVSAMIVSPGGSGTPGPAQVIGTTGAGPQLFILDVTIGAGGGITSINDINNAGDYTTNPTVLAVEPVADNSSSGITGATVSVVMGALAAEATTSGAYSVNPTNPVSQSSSSGSGTGATWDLSISPLATATDGVSGAPLVLQAGGVLFATTPVSVATSSVNTGAAYLTAVLTPIAFSEPWTITAGMASSSADGDRVPTSFVLYDSISDKATVLLWGNGGQGGAVQILHYTSVSVPGVSQATTVPFTPTSTNYWSTTVEYFGWFKIVNNGTNLTYSISSENLAFIPFNQETIAGFGANYNYAGFGIERSQVANGVGGAPLTLSALWNFTQTSP